MSGQGNPFDQFDGVTVPGPVIVPEQPGLLERFNVNRQQGYYSGTLAGAVQGKYAEAWDKQRALDKYDALPQWDTPLEGAAALAGQLVGAASSPENYIGIGAGARFVEWTGIKAAPVVARFAAGAIDAGAVNAVVDAGVQAIEMSAGQRQNFDPVQFGASVALGAVAGGAGGALLDRAAAPEGTPRGAPLSEQAAIDRAAGVRQFPIEPARPVPSLSTEGTATGQMVVPRTVNVDAAPALGETLDATARERRGLGPSTVTQPAPAADLQPGDMRSRALQQSQPATENRASALSTTSVSANVEKALSEFIASRKPLTAEAFAKASGLSLEEAGRALQGAAASGRIIQSVDKTGSGAWRRVSVMQSRPMNVVEFIASIGGLRDDGGELTARDLNARNTMTRFGPMARKNGLSPDQVRERLVEAGYLQDAGAQGNGTAQTAATDVFDLIDRQRNGQTVVANADAGWQAAADAQRKAMQGQDELQNRFTPEQRDLIENYGVAWNHATGLASFLQDSGMKASDWRPEDLRLASDLMDEGMGAEAALERAAIMSVEGDFEALLPEAQTLAKGTANADIPGWEKPNGLSGQSGNVPATGSDTAGQPSRAGGQGLPGADGGQAGSAGPRLEAGADGKPQTVIAGAGRTSDAAIAQRKADAPLRASTPQNFVMDEGLFGDSKNQAELFSLSAGTRTGSIARDAAGTAGMAADPAFTRLQDIAQNLTQALDAAAVRLGRINKRDAAGVYNTRSGVIRLRQPDDFDVLAHELGHHLEAAIGNPVKTLMKAHEAELRPMAYQGAAKGSELEEGFAEYMRVMATNPAYAAKAAPGFDAALRALLAKDHPDVLSAIDGAAAAWRAWNEQPSADAVASTVVSRVEPKYFAKARKELDRYGLGQTIADRLSRAYTLLFDDLNPIARSVRELTKIYSENRGGKRIDLKVADDPYKLARLARGAWNAGHMDISHGVTPYRGTAPASAALRDALVTALGKPNVLSGWDEEAIRRFGAYLWSRRALGEWDRFDQGLIPNPPDKLRRADHSMNVAESEKAFPNFAAAADMIYDWNRALWTKKRDAGLITHEQWQEGLAIRDYVPGLRMLDAEGDTKVSGGKGRGGSVKSGLVKRFRGSRRDVVNPVESLMADAYETSMAIARNDVIKTLDRLARMAGPGGARIAEPIPSHQLRATMVDPLEAVANAAKAAGMAKADITVLRDAVEAQIGDEKAAIFRPAVINEKGEPIAFWRDGGELKALRLADGDFGRQMFGALTQMTRAEGNVFINMLSKPAAVLRTGITAAPEFVLANMIRDQVTAMVFYGQPFKRLSSTVSGMADELLSRDAARAYNSAGGIMGGANVAAVGEARVRHDIQALRKKGWAAERLTSLEGLLQVTEVSETGMRLGLFKTFYQEAQARGLSDIEAMLEAAYLARDHLDFNRRGNGMTGIARLIPFLNAALQGTDKTARLMIAPFFREAITEADARARGDAAKAWARLAAITVASVGLHALMSEHDEYNDLSPQTRATHWMVKWGDKWVAIPKPFELASVINIGEAAWDALAKRDPRWAENYRQGLLDVAMPPNVMEGNPTIATAYELATGMKLRDGTPIVPEGLEGMEPWLQFDAKTSELSRTIGKAINVSPAVIDHMITAHTGSMGRNALALYDYALSDKPLQGWDDFAVTRRFIKDGARGASSTRAFWDMVGTRAGTLEGARKSYQAMIDGGDPASAADFLAGQDEITRAWIAAGTAKAELRRAHPFIRARNAVEAINALRREMSGGTIRTADGTVEVNRVERGAADDILERLAAMEARNALVMMKIPGWADRQPIETATYFRELEATSPALTRALADRFASAKVLPQDAVEEIWPEFRDRLLKDGSDLEQVDLIAQAKAAGFEMDGTAMKRRPRAAVPGQAAVQAPLAPPAP